MVGGGPAGMEAAAVAAQRGHSVTLFDEKSALGGTLDFAAHVKGTHERIADFKNWQIRQVESAGVNVVLGASADASKIEAESPDIVILATGAIAPKISISFSESKKPLTLEEAVANELEGQVCLIGEDLRTLDYATYLMNQGTNVTLIHTSSKDEFAPEQAPWPRAMLISLLEGRGVQIRHGASNISIEDDGVHYVSDAGLECIQSADAVVVCEPTKPYVTLAEEIEKICPLVIVGDAISPSNIMNAISSANLAARAI